MQFWHYVILYYVIINILACIMYGIDKRRAERSAWRIPERTLLFFAFLGGGIGSYAGMYVWHHKTRKSRFRLWVPVWLSIHIVIILFGTYQNNHLITTNYTVQAGVDCRMVQISDLHNVNLWWNQDYLANRVKELEPDLIVITGDIVDSNHTDIESALYTAEQLAKITNTYYVTGNHEYWLSEEESMRLYQGLTDRGIHILSDEYVICEDYSEPFALLGLEDSSLADGTLKELMDELRNTEYTDMDDSGQKAAMNARMNDPKNAKNAKETGNTERMTTILLAHEPQYIAQYASAGVDYVLTGHAHGGQWILPVIGPVVAPDQGFAPEYTSGMISRNGTTMIISRGIGNSVIPLRLFNYPEIVVVDFEK